MGVSSEVRQAMLATLGLWGVGWILLSVFTSTSGVTTTVGELFGQGFNLLIGIALVIPIYGLLVVTQDRPPALRFVGVGLVVVATAAAQSVIDLGLLRFYDTHFFDNADDWANATVLDRAPRLAFLYVWVYALNTIFFVLIQASRRSVEQALRLNAAEAAARDAQLSALRYQLNPHFLFNVLNALSTLVVTGRNAQAEAMIASLSDFLRASLVNQGGTVTTLNEEFETLSAYLEIERLRFPDRLEVRMDCPPDLLGASTPSFIMQPLVENAIKYAVAPSVRDVTVSVVARRDGDDLVLTVEDDGVPAQPGERRPPGAGVGLNNVRARLRTLYGPRGTLTTHRRDPGFAAVVRLPFERRA